MPGAKPISDISVCCHFGFSRATVQYPRHVALSSATISTITCLGGAPNQQCFWTLFQHFNHIYWGNKPTCLFDCFYFVLTFQNMRCNPGRIWAHLFVVEQAQTPYSPMNIFRISNGPFRGLIGVCCDDDSLEIFKTARSLAIELLGLTSASDAKEDWPKGIQEYLDAAGHGYSHWKYLHASGAQGLGLGSNQRTIKKRSRAAFLALALHKASMSRGEVPDILQGPLHSTCIASDLQAPKDVWKPRGQPSQGPTDFQRVFEERWQACAECTRGFNAKDMPPILELRHVDSLLRQGILIPRKKSHDILMAARGLMMAELEKSKEDVLYKSLAHYPWQAIMAGTADKIRADLVGPGIKEFRLEMRRKERCPYTKDPMALFVAVQQNGRKVIHHPHGTKDEPLRFESVDGEMNVDPPSRDEIVRAFRLATNWSVKKRWTAFQTDVFQDILRRFRHHFRPEGFCLTDFQYASNNVQAWELAPVMKQKFISFLQDRQAGKYDSDSADDTDGDNLVVRHAETSSQHTSMESPIPKECCGTDRNPHSPDSPNWEDSSWNDKWWSSSWDSSWGSSSWTHWSSWNGSDDRWDSSTWQSWGSNQWDSADPDEDLNNLHKQALCDLGFDEENGDLRSVMINEFLHNEIRGSGRILAQLDPARSDTAVKTYAHLIREVEVSQLRYSHANISKRFRHGEHQHQKVETLTQDLLSGRLRTEEVKPLVAVEWKRAVWVICGNRRCHAMKEYVRYLPQSDQSAMPKAKVILHDFPRLSALDDRDVRSAFVLKAVASMSTRSEGQNVEVGARNRYRR